ncbi:sigma-70 family RNA polymerase sigma factor [Patescibacteria group bacterium]|nr:sigma-70 family RNA polymerase sigma factor [Patescibacteria group bacterium]
MNQDLTPQVQEQIIEDFKKDKDVFSKVYEHYFEMILKYLAKRTMSGEVAYDITAETFIKAFENFHKFKWKGISIKVWLYRIAINSLKNYRKKPKAEILTEEMEGSLKQLQTDAKAEIRNLDEALFGDDDMQKLSDAIATLNEKYQQIVSLHYFEGMSHEEISKIIERSQSAVKSMMHRALENLRQILIPQTA